MVEKFEIGGGMIDYMMITSMFEMHCSLVQLEKCLKCDKLYKVVSIEPSLHIPEHDFNGYAVIICDDIYTINPLEREGKKVFCKHHKLEDYKETI